MFIDARELAAGAELTADVCIVGTGPAGLSVARELHGSGLRTLVIESGEMQPNEATQSLAAGENSGEEFRPLIVTRARQFGGTSNLWDTRWDRTTVGFRGAPLDPIDFEKRDWVPASGWPFDRAHLEPYYQRAHESARMGPYAYAATDWADDDAPLLDLGGDALESSVWLFGSQRTFLDEWRRDLEHADDVTIVLNANVVELETSDAANAVRSARAVCLPDKPVAFRARRFVLATGGLENARLLLLSNRVNPAGLGNDRDTVGRWFMEHQQVRAGFLTPTDPSLIDRMGLYDERSVKGAPVMGQLHLTDSAMRRERLLNAVAAFLPLHRKFHRFRWDAANALGEAFGAIRRGRLPSAATIAEASRGMDFIAARAVRRLSGGKLFRHWGEEMPTFVSGFGWSALPHKRERFGVLDVIMHTEQAPDPENRVTLSDETDNLGCRRARLHWEWREIDRDATARTRSLLGKELAKAGVGRLDTRTVHGYPYLITSGLHHHMGTTRMHTDSRLGVVDEHCRVHGVANLYMAGCSVFPTGGYINPTLTIMALGVRLGERLKGV